MHSKIRARTRLALLVALPAAGLGVAACGSASSAGSASARGGAQSILQQTFSNGHAVKSGALAFAITVTPTGSSVLTTPITLSLSGPFQSRGTRALPASDFTIGVSALGKQGSLGVISTGTAGYVTLQGDAYQLPQSQFRRLESSFSSASGGSGHGGLAGLGINPQHWLQNPTIVGVQSVEGVEATHIRAGVNAQALLSDLNTFLSKTAKGGKSNAIAPATQQNIASAVRNATVDVWTGLKDRVLRRLALQMTIPVTGRTSSALGGLTSAGVSLDIRYSGLNQPQTITAPSHVLPYSQFTTKLRGALSALGGGLAGIGTGTSGGASPSTNTTASSSSANVQKYTRCIKAAGSDIGKAQKCAPLLNGG